MSGQKNEAELLIDSMADVFSLATSGFDEFYKAAKNQKVSNDGSPRAASQGYSSSAASQGDHSRAASQGSYSTAASQGDHSSAASQGDSSTAASQGYSSTAASQGYSSRAASQGNYSRAASQGDSSTAASQGRYSTAAIQGNYSTAASQGVSSSAASQGSYSTAASQGVSSSAASQGNYSRAASQGDSSTAASQGYSSTAASQGNYSRAASGGQNSACSALGYRATVKGDIGNLLMASEYVCRGGAYIPVGGKADIVDGEKLMPGCWYIVEGGEWVEVDFSDGIFGYVLSTKGQLKKIRTDEGKILFVAFDENGNTAHGESIAEAQKDLIFKAVAKFDGAIPQSATGKEWVGIYRAVTGACATGVRMFVEAFGHDLDGTYTAQQIAEMAHGHYGAEQFAAKVKELVAK